MTAAEIRAKWNNAKMGSVQEVEIYKTFFLAELGAQLAELNEKLTAQSLVSAIVEIQAKLDAEDPE